MSEFSGCGDYVQMTAIQRSLSWRSLDSTLTCSLSTTKLERTEMQRASISFDSKVPTEVGSDAHAEGADLPTQSRIYISLVMPADAHNNPVVYNNVNLILIKRSLVFLSPWTFLQFAYILIPIHLYKPALVATKVQATNLVSNGIIDIQKLPFLYGISCDNASWKIRRI